MKKLLTALLIPAIPNICSASSGMVNFDEIFHATKAGTFVDQKYNRLAGVYATVLGFHDASGLDCLNFNAGYIKNLESQKDSPLLAIGLRADNLMAMALDTDWGRAHTTLSPLPKIEFGPFLSGWLNRDGAYKIHLLYGVGIAIGL